MSSMTPEEIARLPFRGFWEKGYQDRGVSTMGGPNHDIVELAAALPIGARVLDLGCGEGRNAFYLAGRGCRVTAVDRSAAGIEKLRALGQQTRVPLEAVVADISEFPIEGIWDLVMAHGVIDYLDNPVWRRLLTEVKAHTAPGGVNAYTCMLFTDEYPAGPEFTTAGFKHSLAQGELAAFYEDWTIVRHDRYVKWDQHPGIPLHCHPVDKVTARKPGGAAAPPRIEVVPIGEATPLAGGLRRDRDGLPGRRPDGPLRRAGCGGQFHDGRPTTGRRTRVLGRRLSPRLVVLRPRGHVRGERPRVGTVDLHERAHESALDLGDAGGSRRRFASGAVARPYPPFRIPFDGSPAWSAVF